MTRSLLKACNFLNTTGVSKKTLLFKSKMCVLVCTIFFKIKIKKSINSSFFFMIKMSRLLLSLKRAMNQELVKKIGFVTPFKTILVIKKKEEHFEDLLEYFPNH